MKPVHALIDLVPGVTPPLATPLRQVLGRRPARLQAGLEQIRWIALALALAVAGWLACHVGALPSSGQNLLEALFLPLALLHRVTCALALLWAADTVAAERQRGTWDILKTTSRGPELLIRAKWSAIFYRLRPLLLILILPRVLIVGQAVQAAAGYQGHHLDLYLTGGAAEVSLAPAVLLLAAGLTSEMVGVFVTLGLNAVVGLLVTVVVQDRALARGLSLALLAGEFLLPVGVNEVAWDQHARGVLEAVANNMSYASWDTGALDASPGPRLDLTATLQAWADNRHEIWRGSLKMVVLVVQALVVAGLLTLTTHFVRHPVVRESG